MLRNRDKRVLVREKQMQRTWKQEVTQSLDKIFAEITQNIPATEPTKKEIHRYEKSMGTSPNRQTKVG